MNSYETLFVLKPTLTDEETTVQIEKVKAILTKEGAELIATDDMGMRKLAYPVQKNLRGYYSVLFYKANGDFINELERNLKINEEVIKFLTVRYTKTKEMTQFNKLVAAATKKSELANAPVTPVETEVVEAVEAPVTTETTEEAPATTEAPATETTEKAPAITEAPATETTEA